jgi:hypothetical protein
MERNMTSYERAICQERELLKKKHEALRHSLANRLHSLLCRNDMCLGHDAALYLNKADLLLSHEYDLKSTDRILSILESYLPL